MTPYLSLHIPETLGCLELPKHTESVLAAEPLLIQPFLAFLYPSDFSLLPHWALVGPLPFLPMWLDVFLLAVSYHSNC